jgi:membrane protease YdiL (CAAX protease family)
MTTAMPTYRASYLDWAKLGRASPLLYLLAVVLGFIGWEFGSIPALMLMSSDPAQQRVQFQFSFILPALIVLLLVRLLLGRPAWTVALPAWPPRWRDYLVAIGIGWGVMLALLLAILAFMPGFELSFRGWGGMLSGGAPLVLMLCAGFMIQTAFEELYFRGLLMQAVRRLTRWMPVVLVVQAYVFASLHAGNLQGFAASYLTMVPYFLAALYLGWVAWRTGSLIMPMGLHFANNGWNALFINTKGDVIVTAAPFIGPPIPLHGFIGYALAQAVLVCCVVEWLMRRRERRTAGALGVPGP